MGGGRLHVQRVRAAGGVVLDPRHATLAVAAAPPRLFVVTPKEGDWGASRARCGRRWPRSPCCWPCSAYGLLRGHDPATLNNVAFAAVHVMHPRSAWPRALRRARRRARAPATAAAPLRGSHEAARVLAARPGGHRRRRASRARPSARTAARPADQAPPPRGRSWTRYVDADGRVVRRDQGGDTVSEGQAYAMLLAAAERRRRALRARVELDARRTCSAATACWPGAAAITERPRPTPTSTPRARCCVAARRFGRPALAARRGGSPARSRARDGARRRPARAGRRPVGARRRDLNPSYVAPRASALLGPATTCARRACAWCARCRRSAGPPARLGARFAQRRDAMAARRPRPRRPASASTRCASRSGWPRTAAVGAPRGGAAGASLQRTLAPVRTSAEAAGAGRARRRSPSPPRPPPPPRATRPRGRPARPRGPVGRAHPTYYGAAWVALGRVMLTTRWLPGCPPI